MQYIFNYSLINLKIKLSVLNKVQIAMERVLAIVPDQQKNLIKVPIFNF